MIYTNDFQINTVDIQRATKDGRQWLIVPVVAAVESVMSGRLVQRDELAKSARTLNRAPITIDHPSDGQPADNPNIPTVGLVFNAHIDGDSLKAEAWFDIARLNQVGSDGKRILDAINTQEILEVSLGWFSNVVQQTGTFLGKQYNQIVHNLQHDHLAILLNKAGACSVDDGCGLVRNEEKSVSEVASLVDKVLAKLGFSQSKEIVTMAEQDPQEAVVQDNSEILAAITGLKESFEAKVQELNGRIDEIQTNAANSEKVPIVSRLVANERCPLEEDSLTAMSVVDLNKLEASYRTADYSGAGGSFAAFTSGDAEVKYVEVD